MTFHYASGELNGHPHKHFTLQRFISKPRDLFIFYLERTNSKQITTKSSQSE